MSPRWMRRGQVLLALLFGFVAIRPIVASATYALDLPWYPTGDWAVLTMRVADVGTDTPLLGPYSRFGWNHPGPMIYWLLAVPYRLLGGRSVDILTGSGLFASVVVAAVLVLAWRRGRLPLVAITAVALAVLAHSMGPAMLRDPWNPYITLLPLALFAFLAWACIEGDRWAWPALIVAGSFLVQSHVGYALIVVSVVGVAMSLAWRRRDTIPLLPSDRRNRRLLVGAVVGLGVLCWLPVLLDQFFDTGNLGAIASYFASSTESPAGFGSALGQAARHLALPDAPWLGAIEPAGTDGALPGGSASALVLPLITFAIAAYGAWRARCGSALRFQMLVAVVALSGLVATSRITGPLFGYLVRWWWVAALLWWLSIAWSLLSAIFSSNLLSVPVRRSCAAVGVVVCLVITVQTSRDTSTLVARSTAPGPSATAILGHLLPSLQADLAGSGPVIVESTGSIWGSYADAVRLDLEQHGVEVVTDESDAYRFGAQRSITVRTPTATVWVVNADAAWTWREYPDVRLVASWDPLTPTERLAYFVEEQRLAIQLTSGGRPDLAEALATGGGNVDTEGVDVIGVDQDLLRHVESIRRRGDPVAIYVGPPPESGR